MRKQKAIPHILDILLTIKIKLLMRLFVRFFVHPNHSQEKTQSKSAVMGGIHVTRRVLECILETGVYPAQPGEFTQRAFLNGKLDLSQAEAIADVIHAQSDKARQTSLDQLEGALSKQIHFVREQLMQSLGLLELELDFSEEGIALIDKKKVENLFELYSNRN